MVAATAAIVAMTAASAWLVGGTKSKKQVARTRGAKPVVRLPSRKCAGTPVQSFASSVRTLPEFVDNPMLSLKRIGLQNVGERAGE